MWKKYELLTYNKEQTDISLFIQSTQWEKKPEKINKKQLKQPISD